MCTDGNAGQFCGWFMLTFVVRPCGTERIAATAV
jgi:hypothetical protein